MRAQKAKKRAGFLESARLMARIFHFMDGHLAGYFLGGALATCQIAASYVIPYILEQITAIVAQNRHRGDIFTVLVLVALLLALTPVICLGNYLQRSNAARGSGAMREAMFSHIQRLPVSDSMEYHTGDFITLMTSDVQRAGGLFTSFSITSLFRFAVMFPLALVTVWLRDWRIALFGLATSCVTIGVSTLCNPKVRALSRQAQQLAADSASSLLELTHGAYIVRVFCLGARLLEKYRRICRQIFGLRVYYRFLNGLVDAFLLLFQAAAKPAAFLVGIALLLHGQTDITTLVFTATMVGTMADAAQSLSTFIAGIQSSLASAQRVFGILDLPEEEERVTLAPMEPDAPTAAEFSDVRFAYPDGRKIYNGLSFAVRRGETVAVVGGSGGGKTTLFKLLQDFYTPQSGEIALFGRPIRQLSRSDVRGAMAYVPQDCALFEGTVGENIGWGRPEAGPEEIRRAAEQADIADFIESLPEGYRTPAGERGTQLSGGQRQRIAIARAFLKDAPLLLLDEATSALDSESEEEVIGALRHLMRGRTTLVVAHRLSTIRDADRILVMEGGRIVEEGSHDALLAAGGRYAQLYRMQFSRPAALSGAVEAGL